MIRFGTVGTGFITEAFIKGAHKSGVMELSALYSRDEEKARKFLDSIGLKVPVFTSLEEMASSPLIDAAYIASPNAMHSPQAKIFLLHGKHVLVEKAAASNKKELQEVLDLAEKNHLVFMEAMKSLTMPAYVLLKELLPEIGQVRKYIGNYCQYSSRYDRHKAGEFVNTFQKEFSNGSLLDIGIYPLYIAVDLFGRPEKICAQATLLPYGGVDGSGSILLSYKDMEAVILHSKISHSYLPSEIQGEKGSILIDRIGSPTELTLIRRSGEKEVFRPETCEEDMTYEALEFSETIRRGASFSQVNSKTLALTVHEIMDEARNQIGLVYPRDLI